MEEWQKAILRLAAHIKTNTKYYQDGQANKDIRTILEKIIKEKKC